MNEIYTVIGYAHSSFKPDDAKEAITGLNLYCTYERKNCSGLACERFYVSDRALGEFNPVVGDHITIGYNRYGKVAGVALA